MRTNFLNTNFLNTARGPGHPGKNPGTSQIPPFETQGTQTFEGGHELFSHHPFAWKTPTPPRGLRTQKVNLCALLSCLRNGLTRNLHSAVPKRSRSKCERTQKHANARKRVKLSAKERLRCTRLRVTPVALHVSRYTCRSWFPGFYSVLQV